MMLPLNNPRVLSSRLFRAPLHKVLFLFLHAFINHVMTIKHCIDNGKYPAATAKVLRFAKYTILIEMSQIFTRSLSIGCIALKTQSVHLIQFHHQNIRDIQNFVPGKRLTKTRTANSPAEPLRPRYPSPPQTSARHRRASAALVIPPKLGFDGPTMEAARCRQRRTGPGTAESAQGQL